jgi:hypothetical protein
MLSKLTTHAVGTPSVSGINRSSETRSRCVLVRAATTTEPIRSATGSRVRTRTGLSPPGVLANQTSPRLIGPFTPVLCGAPVGNLCEALLCRCHWLPKPGLDIILRAEADEIPVEGVTKELRSIDTETLCPSASLFGLGFVDSEAEHCHTPSIQRMTAGTQDLPHAQTANRTWFVLARLTRSRKSPGQRVFYLVQS